MAFQSKSGQKFTNASQARAADRREVPIAGKSIGDGKQPVKSFSTPEAPRAATADPVSDSPSDSDHTAAQGPQVEVSQDGNMFVVTAKFASEQEAHAAAQALDQSQQPEAMPNPAQAMM